MSNKYSIAALVWALLSAALTTIPGNLIPRITGTVNFIVDSASHFLIFLVLGLLIALSFKNRNPPIGFLMGTILTCIICFSYGLMLEIVQIFIPERAFEWADVSFNSIGAIFGAVIAPFLKNTQ